MQIQKTLECRWERSVLVNVDSDGRTTVSHKELQKLADSIGCSARFAADALDPKTGYAVYRCELTATGGYTVTGLGVCRNTADTCGGCGPEMSAFLRAFDHAALLMFGITGVMPESYRIPTRVQQVIPPPVPQASPVQQKGQGRPPMPEGLPDQILLGSLIGQSYQAQKDTPLMTQTIRFLCTHPEITFQTQEQAAQAAFFRTLGGDPA